MGPRHPITLYRPSRADRGKGTYDETLSDGRTIYGIIVVHESETLLRIDRYTDVQPEDQLVADGAGYRVTRSHWTMHADWKEIPVERTDKPIFPPTVDESS